MRYWDEDIAYFVRTSPYLALAKPASATRFLQRQADAGEECVAALRAYPGVRVEPLSFFDVCLRNLGALDLPFLAALLDHTFRGVVWGSFLAMLEPSPAFVTPLQSAAPRSPRNAWIVDCALATLEGRPQDPEHQAVAELAARCRRLLDGVPRPVVPLRSHPTAAEFAQMTQEREHVRRCYRSGGADAALAAIRGTLVEYYAQDHGQWVRSGAAPPPSRSDATAGA